jgi:hypothetical protein
MAAITRRLVCTGLALACAGCATFKDAPIDSSPAAAVIRGGGIGEPDALGNPPEFVSFTHVDGKPTISTFAHAFFKPYPREVRVAPGGHGFTVRFKTGNGFMSGQLWLDAHPGRTYVIDPVRTNDKVKMMIRVESM